MPYLIDEDLLRAIHESLRSQRGTEPPTLAPRRRRDRMLLDSGGDEYAGPWQAVADQDIDSGDTGTISGDRLAAPVEAFNYGLSVQAGNAVLTWLIPADQTDDATTGELYVFTASPPTCYGMRDFFGVPASPATDLIPLFPMAGACATEAVEDCPAPPPGPTDPPFYVETQAELPDPTNLYGGQIAYVTNDGENSGQYMAIGSPQSLASEWMKV